jgi:type IV pilus assembly protein PilW
MNTRHNGRSSLRSARGFTLPELLVALLIGLFLIGGLLAIVQDNRRTFSSQNQLSQLQDSQRLAMSLMTDVVQATGYFPNPVINTLTTLLPAVGAMAVGQAMTGTYNAATPGDTITLRYATNPGDGILNCSGGSNTTGAVQTYSNTFSVVVNGAGVSQLVCTMNGTVYPLVNNITNLSVLYGVNTAGTGTNVDTYMNATQVQAAGDWGNVVSAQVTLTFLNPLYSAANVGQGAQPQFLKFQRVIGIMAKTGI